MMSPATSSQSKLLRGEADSQWHLIAASDVARRSAGQLSGAERSAESGQAAEYASGSAMKAVLQPGQQKYIASPRCS